MAVETQNYKENGLQNYISVISNISETRNVYKKDRRCNLVIDNFSMV